MALLSNLMVRIGVNTDDVSRGVRRASAELSRFGRSTVARAGKAMAGFAQAALPVIANLSAVGAGAAAAIPIIASMAGTLAELGGAAIAAAPALLAMGAGAFIVSKAFTAMFAEGTAARKALEPLGGMLREATKAGSAAAARGIRPLTEALRGVAQPHVTRFMQGLGRAANQVQKEFLKWAKSADGVKTLRGILEPLSAAVERLAPHVSRLAISFSKMLGRIMGVSASAGSRGLAGVLDWLSEKMDGVDAESVANGMRKLADAARTVMTVIRTVAGWIDKLVTAYKTYTTQFRAVADALSVVAIIFGGPVTAAIAVASLIIRHFDQIKAAWNALKAAFQGGGEGGPIGKAFADLKAAAAIVLPAIKTAFAQIKAAVLPTLKQIGSLIVNDLIPTFASLMRAMAPIAKWLIGVLGPVVAQTFKSALNIIKGALNIIIGVVKVFIAIITGDWGKAWEGVKQILRGATQIVVAIIKRTVAVIKGILQLLWGILKAVFGRLRDIAASGVRWVKDAIVGGFRSAGSWLWNAGKAILDGLISGIRSAIGRVRSLLNSVTGMIPDWKGPMRVDLKLLEPTGEAIMSGLVSGIGKSVPAVRGALQGLTADIPGYAAPRGVAQTARRSQAGPDLVIKSGGSRIDDALVELLRAAVRDRGGDVQKVLGR